MIVRNTGQSRHCFVTNVNPAIGGPYLLVIWTKHAERFAELREFLRERLDPAKKPLAILALDKTLYMLGGDLAKPDELISAITERISESPQLRALISWEADVLAAAGATLGEVGELVPAAERDAEGFSATLDGVLSRLAVAAVGGPNVVVDRRAAINAALAPILADRIVNAPPRSQESGIWDKAITRLKDLPEIDDVQTGRMKSSSAPQYASSGSGQSNRLGSCFTSSRGRKDRRADDGSLWDAISGTT